MVPANVDDLLCDPELEQAAREVDQSVAVLAVPVELERAPDLSLIPTDGAARLFELRDQRLDLVWTPTRDVPHVGVTRGQLERGVALGPDPDRRGAPTQRLQVGDCVGPPGFGQTPDAARARG